MDVSKVDVDKLYKEQDELLRLIGLLHERLNSPQPVSRLRVEFEKEVSRSAPRVAAWTATQLRGPGDLKTKIAKLATIGGVGVVAWAGASVLDAVKNSAAEQAREKARATLVGYYQEFTSKVSILMAELVQREKERDALLKKVSENEAKYREKLQATQQTCDQIMALLQQCNQLTEKVEG